MKTRNKHLSLLLSVCLLFSLFAGYAPAASAVNADNAEAALPVTVPVLSEAQLPDIIAPEEAQANRYTQRLAAQEPDLNTLLFRNADGTETMRVFSHPVKYLGENGEVKDISLSMLRAADGSVQAASSPIETVFSKQLSGGISLAYKDVQIRMTPQSPVSDGLHAQKLSLASLSADGKTVSYPYGAYTSLEYSLTYAGFKEDIVVEQYTGQTEYSFLLSTGGLLLTEHNGSYFLADEKGEIKASIGDIIVFTADERNNTLGSMAAETVKEGETYLLTIRLDADYLQDEKTVYPIRIDPTIEITYSGSGAGAIEDVTINSLSSSASGSSGSIIVGKRETYGISRVLMRFPTLNLNIVASADQITMATVEIRDIMCESESMGVQCYVFNGNTWNESSAVWSIVSANSYTKYLDSNSISYSNGSNQETRHRYKYNITEAVKGWKTGIYNQSKGIIFKAADTVENGTTLIRKVFSSYNRSSNQPSLTFSYTNPFLSQSSDTAYYINSQGLLSDDGLQRRANCYGFSLRMHYAMQNIVANQYTNNGLYYKQQPGEFADKSKISGVSKYQELYNKYSNQMASGSGLTIDFMMELVEADMETLGFTVTKLPKYTSASQIPLAGAANKRLILLVIRNSDYQDYHFYMQNSDNTWSHKPGALEASSGCLGTYSEFSGCCSNPVDTLTNSNILLHMKDVYSKDYLFFYVDKPATIDYAHSNGAYDDSQKTTPYKWDVAGSTINDAKNIQIDQSSLSVNGRIDYKGDQDVYAVNVKTSGIYTINLSTISTSPTPSPYPINLTVGTDNAVIIATKNIVNGNDSITVTLMPHKIYYVIVNSPGQNNHEAVRRYTLTVSPI